MKQTVATTTIFKAVLVFTFLFAAFLSVAIIYNKVYKLKNESLSIIEKYEASTKSFELINNLLINNGYDIKSNCLDGEYGVTDLENFKIEPSINNKKYFYCLKDEKVNDKIFYNIRFFFKFNLPFLGDLFTFNITGKTKSIQCNGNSCDNSLKKYK